MRFANIDGEEIRPVFIVVIDVDEISNLAAEWRSSVAAENQDQRLFANPLVKIPRRVAVESVDPRVWSEIADMQIAFMPLRKRIAKEAVNVAWPAHEMGKNEVRRQN